MLRISSLLRNKQLINKNIFRAGMPGWDRPDPPPTERVPRQSNYTNEQLIFTFFDSSMPEYILTQPQIYEGTLTQALPGLLKIWGAILGSATAIYLFLTITNPLREQRTFQPNYSSMIISESKKINQDKLQLKYMKENPFGFKINTQAYPIYNQGKLFHSSLYYNVQASLNLFAKINKQARNYLNGLEQRSKNRKEQSSHGHGHH